MPLNIHLSTVSCYTTKENVPPLSLSNLFHLFLATLLSLLFLPNKLYRLPSNGLDPSYDLAIADATNKGYIFGTQIIFPYGPIGFLHRKLAYEFTSLPILINTIGILLGLILINLFFFNSYITNKRSYLFKVVFHFLIVCIIALKINSLGETLEVTYSWVYIGTLCLINSIKIRSQFYLSLLYRLLGYLCLFLTLLIKINCIFAVISTLFFISLNDITDFIKNKSSKKQSASIFLALIFVSTIYSIYIYNLNVDFKNYLINSFELLLNFDSAMYLKARDALILLEYKVFYFCYGFIFLNLICLAFSKSFSTYSFLTILISCCLSFLNFKSSITRADTHLNTYIMLGWIPIIIQIYASNIKLIRYINIFFLLTFIATFCLSKDLNPNKVLHDKVTFVTKDWLDSKERQNSTESFKNAESLPEDIRKEIGRSSVDIIPWEISKIFQADLNYSPRPLLQSYHAYSPKLDGIDALHFNSNNAPENLILSYATIDQRYLLWDTPQTIDSIRKNYSPNIYTQDWILCKKTSAINDSQVNPGKIIKEVNFHFNQWIEVPQNTEDLKVSLDIRYNFFGKLRKLLYKPSTLRIYFRLNDGREVSHRVIKQLTSSKLPISYYVANTNDLYNYMSYKYQSLKHIKKFKITGNKASDFESELKLIFLK